MVSAELPLNDPTLLELVLRHMVHGPCGAINPNAPCMKGGICSKGFPKDFQQMTIIAEDRFPLYRRRAGFIAEKEVTRNGIRTMVTIDNRWIVPYSPWLLRQFECHLNVEICSTVRAIKYTLKYTNKGCDRAVTQLHNIQTDEISDYQNHKYIGSNEAATMLLGLKTGGLEPCVVKLALHLPDEQTVVYDPATVTSQSAENQKESTLMAFFALCNEDTFAKTLKYFDVPEFFIFASGKWKRRKRNGEKRTLADGSFVISSRTVARLYSVSPNMGELYYLRLLLVTVPGPTSFTDLKIVDNSTITATFKESCSRRGLLDDDSHLINAMDEVRRSYSANRTRDLFVVIALFCNPSNLLDIWRAYERDLCEDYVQEVRRQQMRFDFMLNDEIRSRVLREVDASIHAGGGIGLSSHGFTIPAVNGDNHNNASLSLLDREQASVNIQAELSSYNDHFPNLNQQQKVIYDDVLDAIVNGNSKVFMILASAGSGKSYALNTIISSERSRGNTVIASASSACAALILRGGRTTSKS